MRELVKQLRRRKRAAVERPRTPAEANGTATEHPVVAPERANETSAAPERKSARAAAANAREQQARSGGVAPERDHETPAANASPSRHIPDEVERSVWARDGEQCAHLDERGVRCRETRFLGLHHVRRFALGGPSAVSNLEVGCRVHNALAAELDFGRQVRGPSVLKRTRTNEAES